MKRTATTKGRGYNPDPEGQWQLNISQTLMRSIPWVFFVIAWFGLSVLAMRHVETITDETIKLLGLVATLIFMLKSLYYIGYPTIVLKPNAEQTMKENKGK